MKYKVAKSPDKTIGENKNKTNWNRSHCQSLPELMLTQVYVATRPQRVKLESILKKQKIKHFRLK